MTPNPATFKPCANWATDQDVANVCGVQGSNAAPLDPYLEEASQVLFELSGRQFNGICAQTIRPCRAGCGCWGGLAALTGGIISDGAYPEGFAGGFMWGGLGWINDGGDPCGCGCLSQIDLPGAPVVAITKVKIDGVDLPTTGYRVDERRYLVRLPDSGGNPLAWPACQNMALPDTQPGTWSVAYTAGVAPPQAGKHAAAQLACELYKADSGQACAIPPTTRRIVRAGVEVDMLILDWVAGAQTGLIHVDTFLAAYNPRRIRRRATVFSPDLPAAGRHVGG